MKPKYNFFKNTNYALNGLKHAIKNEKSFRIELVFVAIFSAISLFLNVSLVEHILLILVLLFVLFAEIVNSAIESVVDLVTSDFNELAKIAKDLGSAAVFVAIFLASFVWIMVILSQIWSQI